MDKRVKKYILRKDRPGKIVPIARIQNDKQLIANLVDASDEFYLSKGDLFESSFSGKQPDDVKKIVVVSIGDDRKVLEVNTDDLSEISGEAAELLLPVQTSRERFELYVKREFIDEALAAKVGDRIKVIGKKNMVAGVIRWIGVLEGKVGTHYAVELDVPSANPDWKLYTKKDFHFFDNYGLFAIASQINFKSTNTKKKKGSKLERLEQFGSLKIGMRVIAFGDENGKEDTLRGFIRFIGKLADHHMEMQVGIELDSPDGIGDGIFEGHRVFDCKQNHAFFTEASAIIDENSYDGKEQEKCCVIDNDRTEQTEIRGKQGGAKLDNTGVKVDLDTEQVQKMNGTSRKRSKSTPWPRVRVDDRKEINLQETNDYAPLLYASDLTASTDHQDTKCLWTNHAQRLKFHENYYANREQYGYAAHNKINSNMEVEKPTLKYQNEHSELNSLEYYSLPSVEEEASGNLLDNNRRKKPPNPTKSLLDPTLQVNSVVQVRINEQPHYGLIKWIDYIDEHYPNELIAGLELEEPSTVGGNGCFGGKKYFDCAPGRGLFMKLSKCRKDERFTHFSSSAVLPANQDVEEIPGNFLPPLQLENLLKGKKCGIEGHHNSCYLDATLFAMFAFSTAFDSVLYREKRSTDITEYDQVRIALKNAIVNPLRTKGFVNAASILRLRGWLDKLGNVQGFMNEEKDPEEFLMLLLKDVLKVDPFLKIRTSNDMLDESYFYQILVDKDEYNPLPTLQYLIELSFHSGSFYLEEVPSVLVVQLPRSGMQKMFKRIRINPFLDISGVMSSASFSCSICEHLAEYSCRDCCHYFGYEHPFVYLCAQCKNLVHQHSARTKHTINKFTKRNKNGYEENENMTKLELFAVVCIKTSHYVTFTKFGDSQNENWMFFDSMADRIGGEFGYNVPEVVECPEIKDWFNKTPLTFTESDAKNTPEKVLRLFEDASLCLYRSSELSMYK